MKLHLGYIFSKDFATINAIGLNEWILNEGRANKMDLHTVNNELAEDLGLSEGASNRWAEKELEPLDLNATNKQRKVLGLILDDICVSINEGQSNFNYGEVKLEDGILTLNIVGLGRAIINAKDIVIEE